MVGAHIVYPEFERRVAVVELLCVGSSAAEIMLFNYPKNTAYSIVRTYNDTEEFEEVSASAHRKMHDQPWPMSASEIF